MDRLWRQANFGLAVMPSSHSSLREQSTSYWSRSESWLVLNTAVFTIRARTVWMPKNHQLRCRNRKLSQNGHAPEQVIYFRGISACDDYALNRWGSWHLGNIKLMLPPSSASPPMMTTPLDIPCCGDQVSFDSAAAGNLGSTCQSSTVFSHTGWQRFVDRSFLFSINWTYSLKLIEQPICMRLWTTEWRPDNAKVTRVRHRWLGGNSCSSQGEQDHLISWAKLDRLIAYGYYWNLVEYTPR
jgi:hypothetical protein